MPALPDCGKHLAHRGPRDAHGVEPIGNLLPAEGATYYAQLELTGIAA